MPFVPDKLRSKNNRFDSLENCKIASIFRPLDQTDIISRANTKIIGYKVQANRYMPKVRALI